MDEELRDASPFPGLNSGGPRVVAIGGGHGLARSLGAIRRYASEVTAVVSVADDGGSSGRLRVALGMPAFGDVRRCVGALLSSPSPLGNTLEYRFSGGELNDHAFGNLLIAALVGTSGDVAAGIAEACRMLGTVGLVLPATNEPVELQAEAAGSKLAGQVRIMAAHGISRISVIPEYPVVPDAVFFAIEAADQIVIGPGSLYTSVLAALAPTAIIDAVASARGTRTFVANLREQLPETAGYDLGDHIDALMAHGIVPDSVVVDTTTMELGRVAPTIYIEKAKLTGRNGLVHDEGLLSEALFAMTK